MTTTTSAPSGVRVGCLALQGSFREHMTLLRTIPGVEVIEVRTQEELESCGGLVIPGGESTTMALVAERWGLIPHLRSFAASGRPIWGTCAGMIFLAERADGECFYLHSLIGRGGGLRPSLVATLWVAVGSSGDTGPGRPC
jgi:5'-phosphate synthase pdxT subunit